MDDVNSTIKKALSFIQLVQNSCDEHRTILDGRFTYEYDCFLQKWRQKQKEEMEIQRKAENAQEIKKDEELEKVEMIDKLLQKARDLRIKSQNSNTVKLTRGHSVMSLNTEKPNVKMKQSTSVSGLDKITLVHKTVGNRLDIVHNSTNHVPKPLKTLPVAKYIPQQRQKKLSSVITRDELQSFKTLCQKSDIGKKCLAKEIKNVSSETTKCLKSGSNVSKSGSTDLDSTLKARCSQISRKEPTVFDYQHTLTGKLFAKVNKPVHVNLSTSLWYPFINTTNESRLTLHITCTNAKELKQCHILFHEIQETMFWLDLFCLVGEEIAAILKHLNKENQNVALVISYIQSIFHKKLQRVPMLAANEQ